MKLVPFHGRKEAAMALIAAAATFPAFSQHCETVASESPVTDSRTDGVLKGSFSEFPESEQVTTVSGHYQLSSQVDTDGGPKSVTSSIQILGTDESIATTRSAVQSPSSIHVMSRSKHRLEDTARYAAGSHFKVKGADCVAQGNNAKVEVNWGARQTMDSSNRLYESHQSSPFASQSHSMSRSVDRPEDTARYAAGTQFSVEGAGCVAQGSGAKVEVNWGGRRSIDCSDGLHGSHQSSLTAPQFHDVNTLENTAKDAAGPYFSAHGVQYVAQGNYAKVEINQDGTSKVIAMLVDKLKNQEPVEGRYKLMIMQNFAFHLFFLTTRMPFSVLGAQCNELKKDYGARDLMALCDMVIRYTEAAGTALGLWRVQDPAHESSIYRKYMTIKKLVQRSVEAVQFTHLMPEGGAQQYCLIWQQKDELAQDLRIQLQLERKTEPYVYFVFELHWRLAYLNAKWSFALPLRTTRSANETEQRIEQQEANDFLKMTRRIPQIFTKDYIAALQGARYQFNLLHSGHFLDGQQFTVQLAYIRWLSDNMKASLIIPDNERVGFIDLHVPQSPPSEVIVAQLHQLGMHTTEEIQAENVPADVMSGTNTSLLTNPDSELEMALAISKADQGQQTMTPAEDEDLQLALALSKSMVDSHDSFDWNDTSSSDQLVHSMPEQAETESLCQSDQAVGVTSICSSGKSMDSGVGSLNPISERTISYIGQNTPLAKLSSSVVTDSVSRPTRLEQPSYERHQRESPSFDQSHYSRQSSSFTTDQLLSELLVLGQKCKANPDLTDAANDVLETVSRIESRSTRMLADLERSTLANLVVKYGDEQLLANSLADILQRRNLNHSDLIMLCEALKISTSNKTDEELRQTIIEKSSNMYLK